MLAIPAERINCEGKGGQALIHFRRQGMKLGWRDTIVVAAKFVFGLKKQQKTNVCGHRLGLSQSRKRWRSMLMP
jgi:hypothetical protein